MQPLWLWLMLRHVLVFPEESDAKSLHCFHVHSHKETNSYAADEVKNLHPDAMSPTRAGQNFSN